MVGSLCLFVFLSWLFVLILVLPAGMYWYPWVFVPLTALVWSSIYWPSPVCYWESFINGYIMEQCRRYFKMTYKVEQPLDTSRNYLICHFPHGVFPLGPLLGSSVVKIMSPGLKVYGISSDSIFKIPLYRHIFSWLGCRPATRENFKKLLGEASCGVVVGGLAEMYMQHEDHEEVLLRSRKGFVEVALETGSPLVPVYYFGNSQILRFVPKSLQSFSRKLRVSLGIVYGRYFLPVPFLVPLHMVVGKPVEVPKMAKEDPEFPKMVEEVHQRLVQALQELFDNNKEEYGWKNRKLVIV
uniref:Acyltransferase n=1 Tax=Arcella intermedia TaxID=1963864 RepID=A0A6B2LBC0_9EUKA